MNQLVTDVVVAGSGLLGLATAFELLSRDLDVTVVGPRTGSHTGQASRAAGAMLTVFSEVEASHEPQRVSLEVGERLAARTGYQAWLDRIGAASNRAVRLVPGVWVVGNGYGPDDAANLRAIAEAAESHGCRAEFASPATVPGLAPQVRAHEALWLPDEASINPMILIEALTTVLHANPRCRWLNTTVTTVNERGEHLAVGAADGSSVLAAHLVLAAGAETTTLLAPELVEQVGAPPLRSGRGVSLLARVPFSLPAAVRTPNRGFACGSHMVPRGDDTIYLGATNRLSTEPDYGRPPTLDEVATLIHDASAELNTDLRSAGLTEVRVGHRPVALDHLPLIGRSRHPMIHLATGTYRCGVLLAPRAAVIVADGITAPSSTFTHPFSPERTMNLPALDDLIDGASRGLVDMLCQPGGSLPPGTHELLERFLAAGLHEIAAGRSARAVAMRRLWQRAPMAECLPLLLDAAGRIR
ncbi:NAD(P)/FAD-dependent oxidoreductase [Salinispora pacifica]|uniref:NAD(P)/FAD-dependent oxidoreductase n=1 Tax=Salinispora pacifica TaxID=351187 RepID=UPI0003A9E39C|nr:FAD-dependent oxidoreductase [Salinispora pacifica]